MLTEKDKTLHGAAKQTIAYFKTQGIINPSPSSVAAVLAFLESYIEMVDRLSLQAPAEPKPFIHAEWCVGWTHGNEHCTCKPTAPSHGEAQTEVAAQWWCSRCKEIVPPERVTFQETHDSDCGGPCYVEEAQQAQVADREALARAIGVASDAYDKGPNLTVEACNFIADEVLSSGLIRPAPTREQIGHALCKLTCAGGLGCSEAACGDDMWEDIEPQISAILSLLSPSPKASSAEDR